MWRALLYWWRAGGDLVQLQGVDDRLLADMGLSRDELPDRVMGRSASTLQEDVRPRRLPTQAPALCD